MQTGEKEKLFEKSFSFSPRTPFSFSKTFKCVFSFLPGKKEKKECEEIYMASDEVKLLFKKFRAAHLILYRLSKICFRLECLVFLVSLVLALTVVFAAERPLQLLLLNLMMVYCLGSSLIFFLPKFWEWALKFQLRFSRRQKENVIIQNHLWLSIISPILFLTPMMVFLWIQFAFNTGAIPLPSTQ